MSAKVSFKTKAEDHTVILPDGEIRRGPAVKVPVLTASHCDMHAFRTQSRLSGLANSQIFPAALQRAAKTAGVHGWLLLDSLPAGVTAQQGYLTTITFYLD